MNPRSLVFILPVYVAFFASGAASLVAEVTWNRMLIVVVGNSLSATAMIIAVFMGGLGLGSWTGGRFLGPRRASLVPYVLLESAIAVYVLLSPAIFDALADLFRSLAAGPGDRDLLTLARVAVSLGALLLPATLMGATFPAIVSGTVAGAPDRRTARTGYLYSINTIGAALGCFAAGYHLLLELGVRFTLHVAFGLYALAAACALLAHLVRSREKSAPVAASAGTAAAAAGSGGSVAAPRDHAPRRFLAVATFTVGFVALAYEVLLTRLAILYLGNSVSVFPLVLTGFLLGTGLSAVVGTWAYGALLRAGRAAHALFGWLALAAAVFAVLTPYLLLTDLVVDAGQFARFADATPRNPLPILSIIIAPTALVGALLPVAIRMTRGERRAGTIRSAATLYALNTAGGLLGASVANHFLVPWIGVQGTVSVLAGALVAVAAAQWARSGTGVAAARWRPVAVAGIGGAAAAAVVALALPGMMDLYAAKIAEGTGARSTELHFLREGRAATVTVLDQDDPARGTYRDMYLNGVEEASTRYWHVQLFKLLGVLPGLVHDAGEPRDALVIAFGAGITAGSVLASDRVASLDVVDLNPDVEGINNLFTDVNGDVFHRPRFHFHNDDGRNYLVTSGHLYDLIISDSTHPRAYDSWILYTDEFYRDVRSHLKPGGIFAQWVPVLGSMRGDLFRIHLNTFRSVFPHATFWYVPGSDQAFLLATPEPFVLDADRVRPRIDALAGWFRAAEYQLDTVERIAGFFWMDESAMGRLIGDETRVNTDDLHYFDKQSAVYPAPPQAQLPRFQADAAPHVTGADEATLRQIRTEQNVAAHLARYGFYGSRADLDRAYCLDPDNGNARWFLSLALGGGLPDPDGFCGDAEIRRYRALVDTHPDNALALNALADLLQEAGNLEEARILVERAVSLEPDSGMILDTYGWVLHRSGHPEAALDVLTDAAGRLPDHPIVQYHLGAVKAALGRGDEAAHHLTRALADPRGFPSSDEARNLLESLGR